MLKNYTQLYCLCAVVLVLAIAIPLKAKAQNIFVPRNNSSSSENGEKRQLFIPNAPNQYRGSGQARSNIRVYEPRNKTGFTKSKAEKEAERNDVFDDVQRMNIELATNRAVRNMEIINQQRERREQAREASHRAAIEQAEREAQAQADASKMPPEMLSGSRSVQVGDDKVYVTMDKEKEKLDQPPRVFNIFQ
ncbi:MAG: hypothetical protein ACLFR0_08580 [Alphaproteobacteria bacterium]